MNVVHLSTSRKRLLFHGIVHYGADFFQHSTGRFDALVVLLLCPSRLHFLILGRSFPGIHLLVLQQPDFRAGFLQIIHQGVETTVHHGTQVLVRDLGGAQGIVAAGNFTVPLVVNFQSAIRFLFNGGEEYLLDEPGTHPAQWWFMVGIAENFLGGRSGGQHLQAFIEGSDAACAKHRNKSIAAIAEDIVKSFIDIQILQPDVTRALYKIAEELDTDELRIGMSKRLQQACTALLASAADARFDNLPDVSFTLLTAMNGTIRSVFELGAQPRLIELLRIQLQAMCRGYLLAVAKPPSVK